MNKIPDPKEFWKRFFQQQMTTSFGPPGSREITDWLEDLKVHHSSHFIARQLGEDVIREVRAKLVFDKMEAVQINCRTLDFNVQHEAGPETLHHAKLIAALDYAKRIHIKGELLDLPDTIRSVRGWSLGNPIPITIRKKRPGNHLMCDCGYRTPYLHSLIVSWFHWDGPIARHPDSLSEAVMMAKKMGFSKVEPRKTVDYHKREESPPVIYTNEGRWCWHISHGAGGYFSYNPPHIERMGKWEECDVLGVVTLFGDIAVHARGYRSQNLKIEKLWVLKEAQMRHPESDLKAFLEETYRCEVIFLQKDTFTGFKDWFKKEDVANLL